jgi:DNA polymerase III epsilon subunit-like protein
MGPYTVARLAGHNAASFDLPRTLADFGKFSMFFPGDYQVLDTMHLYLWLCHIRGKKISAKLTGVAEEFGIQVADAHDALGDCRMTAAIVPKLIEALKQFHHPAGDERTPG